MRKPARRRTGLSGIDGAKLYIKARSSACRAPNPAVLRWIVAFAEVDRFIDTPVKRYSTGMYLRLAFAVAAHLETEILFIDEVLAVGDIEFQRKCLGRVEDVARAGRTVLLVSHNLGIVTQLCRRALWLNEGRLEADGVCARRGGRILFAVAH